MKISIAPAACPGKFPPGIVGAFLKIFFFFFFFEEGKKVRQGEMQMATPAASGSNSIDVPEGFAGAGQSIWASIPSMSVVREGLGEYH